MNHQKAEDRFTGRLREILERELAMGNQISASSIEKDWPCPNVAMIMLEQPFLTPVPAEMEGIAYRDINDPHYWKAEYYDARNNLLLACRFGRSKT